MIDETTIKIFGAGLGGNVLLFLAGLSVENIFNMVCHGLVTLGTLILMYKQYRKNHPKD